MKLGFRLHRLHDWFSPLEGADWGGRRIRKAPVRCFPNSVGSPSYSTFIRQTYMNYKVLKKAVLQLTVRTRVVIPCMMAIPAVLATLPAQANNTDTCTLEYALSTEQEHNLLTDASQGDTCAAENLGNYYYSRQDYRKAFQWYEKVASRGNSRIAFIISAMYRNGLLDTSGRDDQQAHLWLVRAAEQGLDLAQVELADQYANGTGVESNVPQGMYWYEQAANQGHAQAQYALSALYLAGSEQVQSSADNDMERRYAGTQAKANYWLCRAALSNLPQAQYELSQVYDTGRGDLPMNQQKESLWLRKAAANGSQKAQAELTWLSQRSALTKAKEYVDNLLTPSETAVDCPHDAAVLDR